MEHMCGQLWHVFRNGQPASHNGDLKTFELTTSIYELRALGSKASKLAATLYQGSLKGTTRSGISNYQLRNIYSRECFWNYAT